MKGFIAEKECVRGIKETYSYSLLTTVSTVYIFTRESLIAIAHTHTLKSVIP